MGQRLAAWCFGLAAADMKTVITAVCQFGSDSHATWLAVATAQEDFNSFRIYLFDVCQSSIVKAVQLPFVVFYLLKQFLVNYIKRKRKGRVFI